MYKNLYICPMIIKRTIQGELISLMKEYPVVTLTGPRQSGKTTLAKITYPDFVYCNLENPEIRKLAETDANAFFNTFRCPVIIDEIQRVPQLLSYIQTIVDRENENGMFLITGSHQLSLDEAVSQSLAGRTALLRLLPFSIDEIKSFKLNLNRDEQICTGFLPRIYEKKQNPFKAYRNYFQTYIERDLRQMIKLKDLGIFDDFIRLLAGRIGQILNIHSLSNNLGVSSPTIAHWLSILEASFIIFKLRPYFENFGKRIIKSSKIYFTDVGLASYLLGIETQEQVHRDPLLGGLFENMVVLEAVKARLNQGLEPNLFFFRDNNGNEVDLVYKKQNSLIPIEIKAAMTFNEKFLKGINYFHNISDKAKDGYLIYSGELSFKSRFYKTLHYSKTYEIFS
jgi:uncharacterized protein